MSTFTNFRGGKISRIFVEIICAILREKFVAGAQKFVGAKISTSKERQQNWFVFQKCLKINTMRFGGSRRKTSRGHLNLL